MGRYGAVVDGSEALSMASCTICGVSFGKPAQVRAHIQGSSGEHAGIGFRDAEEYISEAPDESAPDADAATDPAGDPPSSPSKDEGLGVPQKADTGPAASKADNPTCPECGGNRWFDASAAGYNYGCADCSSAENWTVWGQ